MWLTERNAPLSARAINKKTRLQAPNRLCQGGKAGGSFEG